MDAVEDGFRDDLAAYALGALSDDEARRLERHLEGCGGCRVELARLRPAAEALPLSVDPLKPPRSLKRALMREVGSGRPGGRWTTLRSRVTRVRLWRPLSVAAACALVAAGYTLAETLRAPSSRTFTARVDATRLPGTRAKLVIGAGDDRAVLVLSHLPPAPGGHVYELWMLRGRSAIPAAVFGASPGGRATAGISGSLRGARSVSVTVERAPAATAPTTRAVVEAALN